MTLTKAEKKYLWLILNRYNSMDEVKTEIHRALAFIEHLENHAEVKYARVNRGKAMCKICGKTVDEIAEEK